MRIARFGHTLTVSLALFAFSAQCEQQGTVASSAVLFDWTSAGFSKTIVPEANGDVFIVRHVAGPTDVSYSVFARDGKLISRFKIEIPEANETIGGRIAALPGGVGYVAFAVAVNSTERAPTLCFLDRTGRLQRVLRTTPFWPYLITAATDGTVWAFGATGDEDVPTSTESLLYHFSPTGEVLGKLLPRSLFGAEPPYDPQTKLGASQLTSAGDRVILYAADTRQLFEMGLDGSLLGSYTIPLPAREVAGTKQSSSMLLRSLRVTDNGAVFAHLVRGDTAGIYELDRANQRWVPLADDLMAKVRNLSLIGSAAGDLALIRNSGGGSSVELEWFRVAPRFGVLSQVRQ